jgi:hypothetical protein
MGIHELKGLLAGAVGPRSKEDMVAVLEELELPIERKARREGKLQGRREGKLRGLAEMLIAQMRFRFGTVPAKVTARIKAADEAELARWGVRVLSAPTPEAVVEDAPAASPRRAKRS